MVTTPPFLASAKPQSPPGPQATWYHVDFATNSDTIDDNGRATIAKVTTYLQSNPRAVATIVGRTDTVGTGDYNMHLSYRRADAVRDALVYPGSIATDRVDTRWTGEPRPAAAASADATPEMAQRVVDIAIH